MIDDAKNAAIAAWAVRGLPARLDAALTAKLLGIAEHDIQILMAAGKLTPLGDPAPNAPKWFSAIDLIQLAADSDWLHKASKELGKYWRHKRERRSDRPFRRGSAKPEQTHDSEQALESSSKWRNN